LRLAQNIEHGFTVLGKTASAALGSHGLYRVFVSWFKVSRAA
jgi:hypothetical protein